jgi:glycosyltransferase involved in cell wall biosynthesis
MRALHLFSNINLTVQAECALDLCAALRNRGHEILFACGKFYEGQRSVIQERAFQLGLDAVTDFNLRKYLNIADNLRDIPALTKFIIEEKVQIVHAHLLNDHIVGGYAARNVGVPVVRTVHGLGRLWQRLRTKHLTRGLTDAVIVASEWHKKKATRLFDSLPERVWLIEPAVDLERFSPERALPDKRKELGLDEGDFVVGITAWILAGHRFAIFLRGVKLTLEKYPHTKALIISRAGHRDDAAFEATRRLGLQETVVFSECEKADDYPALLKALDVEVFLTPGLDETCRSIREAFASGRPVIRADRGIIPQIIDNEVNGYVLKDTPEKIADAAVRLARNRNLLEQFSCNALAKAREKYDLKNYAAEVEKIYELLLSSGKGNGSTPSPASDLTNVPL